MSTLPPCPQCHDEFTYEDGTLLICPSCGHEWNPAEAPATEASKVWKDANGHVLQNGDTVTLVKDLKIKGSSSVVKVGTKVESLYREIRALRIYEGASDVQRVVIARSILA
jgi:protein PhnA